MVSREYRKSFNRLNRLRTLGAGATLRAGASLGAGVSLGAGATLGAGVTLLARGHVSLYLAYKLWHPEAPAQTGRFSLN